MSDCQCPKLICCLDCNKSTWEVQTNHFYYLTTELPQNSSSLHWGRFWPNRYSLFSGCKI